MDADLFTIGWMISLFLLSIDVWLTYLTMSLYFKQKKTELPHHEAKMETVNMEQNLMAKFLIRRFEGLGFVYSAAFSTAFFTVLFWFAANYLMRDAALLGLGTAIGMQLMVIQTHIFNLGDLRKWNSGRNH